MAPVLRKIDGSGAMLSCSLLSLDRVWQISTYTGRTMENRARKWKTGWKTEGRDAWLNNQWQSGKCGLCWPIFFLSFSHIVSLLLPFIIVQWLHNVSLWYFLLFNKNLHCSYYNKYDDWMCFYCFIDPLHKNYEILKCLCAHTPTYRYPVLTEIHCYGRLSTYPLLTSYLMLRAFIHRERESLQLWIFSWSHIAPCRSVEVSYKREGKYFSFEIQQ